ncbi:uncharacterized protein LOC111897994 [Lactuca sativa]|uniref:C2H2-type domain-containing protein n=1 Tax=Lactuca sativa TaxID=4236 RepID=A0A9R1UE68_LACSA|nr:uncharacterized protein LOC111897994 [Lactuca sativa]KAJ0185478.1 hypothetical protein LSAT_V11C900491440 [Lactuca sativa]
MEKIIGDEDRIEERMIGSPSSDGKMVIKLKIPKLAAATEGEKSSEEDVIGSFSTSSSRIAKEGETMNQGKRVCPECKKEFSSGKALGGHMRVHVQAANKNTFLKHSSKTTKFNKDAYHDFNNGDENLKKQHQQQQEERKPYYASCVNDEGKPTCSLCGKIFPSMKSLFGHMRCHPERLWRGILPPPNTPTPTAVAPRRNLVRNKPSYFASSTSSSSLSENYVNEEGSNVVDDGGAGGDQVVDLTKFLRGWSVTERRGRRALKAADDDEVLLEAVEDLMSLAHADPSPAESDVTQRQLGVAPVVVLERSNSNSLTNKDHHKIDEKSPSIHLPVSTGKGKAAMVEEIEPVKMEFDGMIKNFSDNESDCRNTQHLLINYKYKNPFSNPSYNSPTKIKKRKKMKLMMELEQLPIVAGDPTLPPPLLLPLSLSIPEHHESKYKCTTCHKCFATHQALGGHRSSHNKTKLTSTTDHHHHHQTEPEDYESSLMNLSGEHVEKEVEFAADAMVTLGSNGILHQCKICDKIFPTGQALGGHKRCHWTGTIEAQAAPSSQITSTGEAASSGRRKGLDIDLNEFPPATMMEDEAGNVNGNGYASSSYNSNMG